MNQGRLYKIRLKLDALFVRRKLLLLLVGIGMALGVVLATVVISPRYVAKNQVYFYAYAAEETGSVSYMQLLNSESIAESYVVYMKERFMFSNAAEHQPKTLSRVYTAEELQRAISVSVESDINIISVRVKSDDPQDAAILCDFYIDFSMSEILEMTGVGEYQVFNKTKVPTKPIFSDPIMFALVGGILALGIGALFVLSSKAKICSEYEIKEIIPNANVLASVDAMK